MPRHAADLEEALKKKGGLTLSQLANYDDLITDALVDRVYFWSTIRKLKSTYHACRGVQEQDVCNILQKHTIIEKEPATAHKNLISLPGIQKFYRGLGTEDEKEHFERHLRKYINIYLPDCPFEVGTTNRYTVMTAEAAIIARKHIRRGEQIKYLTGIQVEMTEKEEKELSSRTDFSIVLSSRRKRPSLFLGPARFANHDCDSNARLNTSGPHGIHIVACKEIAPGDEITVTYGEDYFGEDNCECLCGTCEENTRNGWDPKGPLLRDDSSDEDSDEDEDEEEIPKKRQSEPSASRKRKRGHEGPLEVNEEGEEVMRKRGPGRPRKYPRPEDLIPIPRKAKTPVETEAVADENEYRDADGDAESTEKQRDGKGRFVPQKAVGQPVEEEGEDDEVCEVKRSGSWLPFSLGATREPFHDDILEKIKRMLGSVVDHTPPQRNLSHEEAAEVLGIAETEAGAEDDGDEVEVVREIDPTDVSEWPRDPKGKFTRRSLPSSHASLKQPAPAYARAMSRSPERTPTTIQESERRDALSLGSGTPKARLPTIKKERSFSSLRNVTNADEARFDVWGVPDSPAAIPDAFQLGKRRRPERPARPDVYDFPAEDSPAPSPAPAPAPEFEPPKRKRGRPRKNPRPEEQAASATESMTESTSPSSHGTDSASNGSVASSATSVSTFTAGNIALNICTMLTEEVEIGVRPESGESEQRLSARKDTASGLLTPRRGRSSLRKGLGQAAVDRSAPPIRSIEIEETKADNEEEDEDEKRGPVRTPGDYYLTRALLATAYHRWVECRNCDKKFVQSEAYLTRIACPRCERHSKLYGYYWPKTDKEGKNDLEERVLDHRTIHRFIEPEDERSERKGRKTLVELRKEEEREVSERQESEESERVFDRRLRLSPRRSESRRKLRCTM